MPAGPRPPIPVGVALLDWHGDFDTAPWHLIMHAELSGHATMTLDQFTAYLDDVIAAADDAELFAAQSNRMHVTGLRGVLEYLPGLFHEADEGSSLGGSVTGSAAAASSAAVISWTGSWHYRGGKPKNFMPGVPGTAFVDSRVLTTVYTSSLADRALAFLNGVDELIPVPDSSSFLGTVSFQTAGAWRTPPIFRPYTGAIVHPRIGSQRRRDGEWLP